MDLQQALSEYRLAVVNHVRAYDEWVATTPGAPEAATLEAKLRERIIEADEAERNLILLYPEVEGFDEQALRVPVETRAQAIEREAAADLAASLQVES
jgi:hypothetical protein